MPRPWVLFPLYVAIVTLTASISFDHAVIMALKIPYLTVFHVEHPRRSQMLGYFRLQ